MNFILICFRKLKWQKTHKTQIQCNDHLKLWQKIHVLSLCVEGFVVLHQCMSCLSWHSAILMTEISFYTSSLKHHASGCQMSSTLVPSCISVQLYWWRSDVFLSPVYTAFSINTESNIHGGELFHNDECWSNTKTGLSIISFQQNMNSTFVVVLGCTHCSSLLYVEFCRNPKTMWVL